MLICGKYFCFRKCLISRRLRVVSEPPVEPQADDPEHGFAEDAAAHLARAQLAVDEDDRNFLYLETALLGGELHFYLEGISFEAHLVQFDGLQHAAAVTFEAGRGVVYLQPRDDAHVFRGVVGHQDAPHGPVHHVHPVHVARPDGHVVPLLGASGVQSRKVVRVVAEVGVHLEDIVVFLRHSPFESCNVSCAEA